MQEECGICRLLTQLQGQRETLKVVYESGEVLALHSTKPFAQVHVFIAAKRHVPTIFDMTPSDDGLALEMMRAVKAAAREVIATNGGCKLEMYLGDFQNTKHVHCHVIYDPSID